MAAGKNGAFQSAVDSYLGHVEEVIDTFNHFGDTALEVVQGGTTDGADIGIGPLKYHGEQDWSFLTDIEAKIRAFVVGSAGTEGGTATGIMQYMASVAIAISMVFFLISILQLVTEDRFTPEFLVKFFAKFVIAFCVIIWSPDIFAYMIDFGDAFASGAAKWAQELSDTTEAFDSSVLEAVVKNHSIYHYKNVGWDNYEGIGTKSDAKKMLLYGLFEAFPFWMEGATLGICKFITYILNAVVMFIVLTRILELYIRGAFLPVAAGLMSDDGWKGAGGRYFRKLMSLATQSAVIMVVSNVIGVMVSSAMSNIFTSSILSKYGVKHCKTLEDLSTCTKCLAQISAPIDLPVLKPMVICAIVCVAGIAMMFKAASLMDDLWGAR